jgi:lysophospholipase
MSPPNGHSTGFVTAKDGIQIFFRNFEAGAEKKAHMVIVHGLCEHSGRYLELVQKFSQKGICVTAYDQRGHGQSAGRRGHILRFEDLLGDLLQIVEKCRNETDKPVPLLLLGHSLGGLVVLRFAQQFGEKTDGVIASSPALAPAISIPKPKAVIGRFMSRIWPQLMFDNELDPDNLSHDKEVVRAYINDPLVGRRVSARLFTEMIRSMTEAVDNAPMLTKPLLIQAAGDDRLVDTEATKVFFQLAAASDKTLHIYQGLFHEIFNEELQLRSQVMDDLFQWLESHIY